jgi:hypothetical protein
MSPRTLNCSARDLREQLNADGFFQMLRSTTFFRDISLENLPLIVLEKICEQTKLIPKSRGETFRVDPPIEGESDLYEILSGYVLIQDRPNLPSEKKAATRKIPPPAFLAWRVPGELLGDFQFSLPNHTVRDHIVVTDDCELLLMPSSLVKTIARYEPQIYLNIAANLALKAVKARVRAQILRLPTVKCQIAKLFIELLEERGTDPRIPDRDVVNGTFYIKDIAAFIGAGEHSTQDGIHLLIKNSVLKHYQNERSGRFEVCKTKAALEQYLERAWSEAIKKRDPRPRKKR